jgi:hypothetical protein
MPRKPIDKSLPECAEAMPCKCGKLPNIVLMTRLYYLHCPSCGCFGRVAGEISSAKLKWNKARIKEQGEQRKPPVNSSAK